MSVSQVKSYLNFENSLKAILLSVNKTRRFPDFRRFDDTGLATIRHEYNVYLEFLDGYKRSLLDKDHRVKKIFHTENSWNVHYYFIGEVRRRLARYADNRSAFINFSNPKNLDYDHMGIYLVLCKLSMDLESMGIDMKKSGFPKYFRDREWESYRKFCKKLDWMMSHEKLVPKLLWVPDSGKVYVRNQVQALKMSRDLTDMEVIELCKKNNHGTYLKIFGGEDFQKAAIKLFDKCRKTLSRRKVWSGLWLDREAEDKILKKQRICLSSCRAYIRYLALMSLIQSRKGRTLEMNAAREKYGFGVGYKVLREACTELGWLVKGDQTFCKGVRSKSFFIRVCVDKEMSVDLKKFDMNNIELEFLSIEKYDEKIDFAMSYGLGGRYLHERAETFEKHRKEIREIKREHYKIYGSIKFDPDWRKDMFKLRDRRFLASKVVSDFKKKHSTTKNFDDRYRLRLFPRRVQEYRIAGWN